MRGDTRAEPGDEVRALATTPTRGRWVLTPGPGAWLQIEFQWSDDTQWRRYIGREPLLGSAVGALDAATATPVALRLVRGAGTFELDGDVRGPRGGGTLRFVPDRRFVDTLRALGVEDVGEPSDHDLKNLAWGDLSAPEVRELRALGVAPLSMRDLIDLAIRQVTPAYVRSLREAGAADVRAPRDVIDLRMAGVTAEFVREARALGHTSPTPEQLIDLRRRARARRDD